MWMSILCTTLGQKVIQEHSEGYVLISDTYKMMMADLIGVFFVGVSPY